MKFNENWLRKFVNPNLNTNEICDILTLSGLEVESISKTCNDFTGVFVGQIDKITKHEDAKKLNICSVNVGDLSNLQIVCGASNIYEGMKVAVAKLNAILPINNGKNILKIEKTEIRGVISMGMMCSEKELGISDSNLGIMDLPQDAKIGTNLRDYLDLNDKIIELDLTPNRADCLSVLGVAREVSALTKTKLSLDYIKVNKDLINSKVSIKDKLEVEIKSNSCGKYFSCIIKNVNSKKETPVYIKERLRRCGLRSKSIIVDITNYILLELGQPLHSFDLDKISQKIIVRQAQDKEKINLLTNENLVLDKDDLVIADNEKVLALAGIMGGSFSAVNDETTNIFLESAYFVENEHKGKARKYGLSTDSSYRYERGVDYNLQEDAIYRAIYLIQKYAGGELGEVTKTINKNINFEQKEIILRKSKLNSLIGFNFTNDFIEETLTGLSMNFEKTDKNIYKVMSPSYRFDINIEEDLIEEIARIYGYINLRETTPTLKLPQKNITEKKLEINDIKKLLVNSSYNEVINYSFTSEKLNNLFSNKDNKGIHLLNPISEELKVMRTSLIPSLINIFKNNINRQQNRVRIFEVGEIFLNNNFVQETKISGLVFGNLCELNWSNNHKVNFYNIKNDVENILSLSKKSYYFKPLKDYDFLHPGQSAKIFDENNKEIGLIGKIHPSIMKDLRIKAEEPFIFELSLDFILNKNIVKFNPISKLPLVSRDLAFIVDKNINSYDIISTIKDLNNSNLKDVTIFDIYSGENLDLHKKSFAFNLTYQSNDITLKDEEINNYVNEVIHTLENKFQAILRD